MSVPSQQLVAHLPGPARASARSTAPPSPPAHPTPHRRAPAGCRPRRQLREHRRQGILPERRVEENHVEALAGSRGEDSASRRRATMLTCAASSSCASCAPGSASAARSFSTITTRAAPREAASKPSAPLPANRSRQARPSRSLAEPVEQRLAHAIGRRPQSRDARARAAAGCGICRRRCAVPRRRCDCLC